MKLWLDDVRNAPDSTWVIIRTVENAWDIIRSCRVALISLDHDLGENQPTGYDLCNMIEEAVYKNELNYVPEMVIHSANPVGRQNMQRAIESIKKLNKERKERVVL